MKAPRFSYGICLLLFCLPVVSAARIVYVSTYASLRDACQTALPGDTIVIASGTYTITGATRIMISNRPGPVLVRGATGNPADVVIRGQGQDNSAVQMVFNLDNASRWTFRDLSVRDSYYHGFKFDHTSADCALINVVMRDHGESGVKGTSDPAAGTYPDRLLIDSCDIGFTQTTGGTRSVVEGVDGVGVNDWIIRNSRFVNVQKNGNPAYAIFTKGNSSNTIIEGNRFENCFIGASFGGGGTAAQFFRDNDQTYEHRNGIIRNNIVVRCSDAGIYINKGVNCRIYNNTLFECVLTIQLRFTQTTGDVRNNLVRRASSNPNEPVVRLRDGAVLLGSSANLAAVPADFVVASGSYTQLDLHLGASSQAVDAGTTLSTDVPCDFEGQLRPAGSGWDVGADEFGMIPVELSTFIAAAVPGGVLLQWRTESESENFGFEVQRASGAEPFITTGFVPGNGSSTRRHSYVYMDWLDSDTMRQCPRYRLLQIDYSGAATASPEIAVDCGNSGTDIGVDVWPMPAEGVATITVRTDAQAMYRIINTLGRIIDARTLAAGSHRMDFRPGAPGVYVLTVTSAADRNIRRIVIR